MKQISDIEKIPILNEVNARCTFGQYPLIDSSSDLNNFPGSQPALMKTRNVQEANDNEYLASWKLNKFHGCQPVPLNPKNIEKIIDNTYLVSWKSDGTRYLMYIDGASRKFFVDEKNNVFQIESCKFSSGEQPITDTLLDIELVITDDNRRFYLVNDLICFEGELLTSQPFYKRYRKLEEKFTESRCNSTGSASFDDQNSPGVLRNSIFPHIFIKEFLPAQLTSRFLSDKFLDHLPFKCKGLIFQPSYEGYTAGRAESILEWKNSKDKKSVYFTFLNGNLHIGKNHIWFDQMRMVLPKEINGKIIECSYDSTREEWFFIRERLDRKHPDSFYKAKTIHDELSNTVTRRMLFATIDRGVMKNMEEHEQVTAKRARYR